MLDIHDRMYIPSLVSLALIVSEI